MKKQIRISLFVLLSLGVFGFIVYLFTSNDLAILEPAGLIAEQQRDLLIFASILSLFVIVPVYALTLFIALRYRQGNEKADYQPEHDHSRSLEALWWGIPIIIIFVLSVVTWKTTHSLDPYKPIASDNNPVKVQVVSLQWKWLFIYPEEGIASVNYLRIPEGRPINFELTSDAPMNSFWIPKLGGQVYAMTGMQTKLHLQSDQLGQFEGYSANISGEGFSDMRFVVESTTEEEYRNWVAQSSMSRLELTDQEYEALAKPGVDSQEIIYRYSDSGLFGRIIGKYDSHQKYDHSSTSESNSLQEDSI